MMSVSLSNNILVKFYFSEQNIKQKCTGLLLMFVHHVFLKRVFFKKSHLVEIISSVSMKIMYTVIVLTFS